MAIKKVLDYTCFVKGVFGRNRTVKTTTLKLKKGVDPSTPILDEEVIRMAKEAMKVANVRVGSYYKIDENPIELEEMGTYTSEKFALFSERCIEKGVLS